MFKYYILLLYYIIYINEILLTISTQGEKEHFELRTFVTSIFSNFDLFQLRTFPISNFSNFEHTECNKNKHTECNKNKHTECNKNKHTECNKNKHTECNKNKHTECNKNKHTECNKKQTYRVLQKQHTECSKNKHTECNKNKHTECKKNKHTECNKNKNKVFWRKTKFLHIFPSAASNQKPASYILGKIMRQKSCLFLKKIGFFSK